MTVERIKRYFLPAVILGGAVCLSLAVWKMLAFHWRLNALENPQWEQRLAAEHIYARPIVLFGDSQIFNWPVATSFGVLPVLDRGLVGDWVANALPRFERQVPPLNPAVVVILIGTNDLAHHQSRDDIVRNIEGLARAARRLDAAVILCSLLPARGEAATVRPRQDIEAINASLRSLAAANGWQYVDLYSGLLNDSGELAVTFSDDGLHANQAGYVRMTELLLPRLLRYVSAQSGAAAAAERSSSAPAPAIASQ